MHEGQKIPLQQTKAWQDLQQSLGETTFFLSEKSEDTSENSVNYQMLIIKKSTPLGPYFYLPYGPYIAKKAYAKTAYKALESLIDREHVIFTRIEPKSPENASYWLKQPRIKKTKDLSPKETWVLDLTPPLDEIYRGMKQNTRNLAKNYSKKGISVEKVAKTPENTEILWSFLQTVAKNRHFSPIEKPTLSAEVNQPFASLFIAYYAPEETGSKTSQKTATKLPIAASLFFDSEGTRFYMQSGADQAFRNLPATLAILAEAIKDAKRKNLQNFDFWGIAPENADKNHPWAGFTKFKKSFGGQEIAYAGTYDLISKPLKYRLYTLLRKLNRLKRKIIR